mgnify:CR=1 FL=1
MSLMCTLGVLTAMFACFFDLIEIVQAFGVTTVIVVVCCGYCIITRANFRWLGMSTYSHSYARLTRSLTYDTNLQTIHSSSLGWLSLATLVLVVIVLGSMVGSFALPMAATSAMLLGCSAVRRIPAV